MSAWSSLNENTVCAACEGKKAECDQVAGLLLPQVRLMVAARLGATPSQYLIVEEIAQQAMLSLVHGLPRLQVRNVAGLKSYTSRIVSNKVADFLRRKGDQQRKNLQSLDSTFAGLSEAGPLWQFLSQSGTSIMAAADREETLQAVMHELAHLKLEYRNIIALAFFDQLPTSDIADRLGVSRAAASMLLLRAVKTLRRNITGSSRIHKVARHET